MDTLTDTGAIAVQENVPWSMKIPINISRWSKKKPKVIITLCIFCKIWCTSNNNNANYMTVCISRCSGKQTQMIHDKLNQLVVSSHSFNHSLIWCAVCWWDIFTLIIICSILYLCMPRVGPLTLLILYVFLYLAKMLTWAISIEHLWLVIFDQPHEGRQRQTSIYTHILTSTSKNFAMLSLVVLTVRK